MARPRKYRTFDRQGRRIKSYRPPSLPTVREVSEHAQEYESFPSIEGREEIVRDEADLVLGNPLGHLPTNLRPSFMDNDLILFRRKEFSELGRDSDPEDLEAGASFQKVRCFRCLFDWLCVWLNTVLLYVLTLLFHFGMLYDLTAAVAFGVMAMLIITQIIFMTSLLLTHLRSGGGRRHHHWVDHMVFNLLPLRSYTALEDGSGAASLRRFWKTHQLAQSSQRHRERDEATPLTQDTPLVKC